MEGIRLTTRADVLRVEGGRRRGRPLCEKRFGEIWRGVENENEE